MRVCFCVVESVLPYSVLPVQCVSGGCTALQWHHKLSGGNHRRSLRGSCVLLMCAPPAQLQTRLSGTHARWVSTQHTRASRFSHLTSISSAGYLHALVSAAGCRKCFYFETFSYVRHPGSVWLLGVLLHIYIIVVMCNEFEPKMNSLLWNRSIVSIQWSICTAVQIALLWTMTSLFSSILGFHESGVRYRGEKRDFSHFR